MSHELISRSADLKALYDDGFEISVVDGHLVVSNVPYLSGAREPKRGVVMTPLTFGGEATSKPGTHVVHFRGEYPCNLDGSPIAALRHASGDFELSPNLRAQHTFSNKPPPPATGFDNYEALVRSYVNIISGPANAVDPTATAQTYRVVESTEDESVFRYLDTASSRAGIVTAQQALASQNVAIVGLGGTGAYVLDQLAKTPVRTIHLYDGDDLISHNAFRAPGAAAVSDLTARPKKVTYFGNLYGRMRRNIVEHPVNVDPSNIDELKELDFVFLCVDNGAARKLIVEALLEAKVAFVDGGMGVHQVGHQLMGIVRVTTHTPVRPPGFDIRKLMDLSDATKADAYDTNIQIADLNALNAIMMVLRWKKWSGFYVDDEREHHSTYTTAMHLLTSDGCP
ncbi:MAG: ThiF family adenylyltransferase [Xanthomonadales bacterium]|nr:ThiF family adenylyltransferase [Nitrosomonas nitrosa]MCB1599567.1 ThiF family adenylyltransferase [Xanthomonadales bacterium]